MILFEVIFLLVFQLCLILIIIIGIRYKLNDIDEKNKINMVLSKLEFTPKFYKINRIMKENKIYIKCHYYTTDCSHYIISNYIINYIQYNSKGYYCKIYGNHELKTISLNNYDPGKDIGIMVVDILIDFKNNNYKIITFYFQIINCIIDNNNNYIKIINYLDDPQLYITVNNIYDSNLDINDNIPKYLYQPFYQQLSNKEKRYRCNYVKKFNITINDKNKIVFIINPILYQNGEYPNTIMELSKDIHIKPHINNHIAINYISGPLI
jgi:hypothetical protein